MAISDRITVLRHGRVVGTTETTATDKDVLTRMMVGQDIPHEISRSRHLPGPALFSARHLRVEDDRGQIAVRDISFETHAGEILGIAGVDGNGQRELAETLVGLRPTLSGEIRLGAQEITGLPVSRRRMAHVPQDRLRTGLIPGFSVEENLILGVDHLERYSRYGALDQRAIRAHANDLVRRFDIRLQDVRQPVSTLSGGNQQKVVFARELSRNSDVLICFNPTRGVDVRATDEIHRRIIELRDRGAGILLISTELDEIIRLSDRIAVMCAGRIMGILTPDAPRQRIGALMAGMV
jgi:simple sugar transport system ATP-binding protein